PHVAFVDAPLPRPVPVARRHSATTFRLVRRTLADRARLDSILGDDEHLPLDAPFVRAVGLAALGDVKSPNAIARALQRVDDETFDEVWEAVVEAWDAFHYPARLLAPVPCPKCGARHDLEVPPRRPLPITRARRKSDSPPFPSLDQFHAHASEITQDVVDQ